MKTIKDKQGKTIITYIEGDGIGPEVMSAARKIIDETNAKISWEPCVAGKKVFEQGNQSGVPQETIDSIKKNGVVFKGPLETPVGFGQNSANVTLRKLFETYANIRPVRELPSVITPFSGRNIDLVIVRENVEDLYAGIEYMQTPGVAESLKLITRKGCEKIVRLAFEFAISEGRKKVHCATKANIMKLSEGLLKKTFESVASRYPEIEAKHIIIDNCAHQLVRFPEEFDVIVTTNMNGDILSDLTSGLIGGLGFAPSANIGKEAAMFEAVHGSAPDIAGKNIVNPTAVILAGVMMLRHIGELEAADQIQQSILFTLEQGIYTSDVNKTNAVSTTEFTKAVINNLGKKPKGWVDRETKQMRMPEIKNEIAFVKAQTRRCLGFDIFLESGSNAAEIGSMLKEMTKDSALTLKMISNRGTKVYPDMGAYTDCIDHWRCRFVAKDPSSNVQSDDITELTKSLSSKFEWMHIEKLWEFDGERSFSLSQGED
ncbi:MAG: NADP-dependent isocitrate dehydrogenase [Bdellovibrionales bacterium]|nr:NADP-dependent isocitrate dehydrogenase [Bdellovibrionales bacterium]